MEAKYYMVLNCAIKTHQASKVKKRFPNKFELTDHSEIYAERCIGVCPASYHNTDQISNAFVGRKFYF